MSLNVPYCKNPTSPLTLLSLFCYIHYSVLICPIGQTLNKNYSRGLKNDKDVHFFSDIYSNTGYCRSWLNTQFPNKVCTLEWIKSVLKLECFWGLQLKEGKLAWNGYSLFGCEKIIRIIISKPAQRILPKLGNLIWFLICICLSKRYLCFFITHHFFYLNNPSNVAHWIWNIFRLPILNEVSISPLLMLL